MEIVEDELICEIAQDRMIADLCLQWYILHTKPELTEQEQAEMFRLNTEINALHNAFRC